MNKSDSQSSIKKIQTDIGSLAPSAVVTLFEIDLSTLGGDLGIILPNEIVNNASAGIFRFHNNIKLFNSSIYWQDKEYILLPVDAAGFEYNSEGTLPRPKFALSVADNGISELSRLKIYIRQIGDLVGAKITRIRTFAKYLDRQNFINEITNYGFDPDPYAEFPREIYYFDRKSRENKNTVEYELASILDVEGIKLPGRLVVSNVCTAQYRGCGCCYEFNNRKTTIHGDATLPEGAPPVANVKDELISDILGADVPILDRGEYFPSMANIKKGHHIYIQKNRIKYYFVARVDNPINPPPDANYWIADTCSRFVTGCKLRYGVTGAVIPGTTSVIKGRLRFLGFPSTNKLLQG